MENIYQKIEELSESNSKNLNQYLACFVLSHFREVGEWTISEFTKKTNCSKPTVVRFCKALGCGGFAEFKFKLKDYLAKKEKPEFNPVCEQIDARYLEIAQKTFQEVYQFYQKQKKTVNKLIQELVHARLIYIFGMDMSYNFSKTFCNWLRLLGLNVIHEKDFELIDGYLSRLQDHDMVICFSLAETNSWLKKAALKLNQLPNYKFGVLELNSPLGKLFNDFAVLPEFEADFWNLGSIRTQALAQFLDYLYFDLSKVLSLPLPK